MTEALSLLFVIVVMPFAATLVFAFVAFPIWLITGLFEYNFNVHKMIRMETGYDLGDAPVKPRLSTVKSRKINANRGPK